MDIVATSFVESVTSDRAQPRAEHSRTSHPRSQSQRALSRLLGMVVVPCSAAELRGKQVATITEWLASLGMSE
jgi:hypothetical protein